MKVQYILLTFIYLILAEQVLAKENEPISSWYCLCYSERAGDQVIQATACRSTLQQCQKLEQKAKNGSKTIIADSLQVPCLEVKGAHPAEDLGFKDLWKPSKKLGSVWSPNACYLGEKIYQRKEILSKAGEPTSNPPLLLQSGWQLKPHFNEMIGFTWLTAEQGKKSYSYTRFPLFEKGFVYEGVQEPSCFSHSLRLQHIYQEADLSVVSFLANCESDGADVFSFQELNTLLLIKIKDGVPHFTHLWSGKGGGNRNESIGESNNESYKISLADKILKIVYEVTQCNNLGEEDSKCKTVTQKILKTIDLSAYTK